jgi:hypothetical protein
MLLDRSGAHELAGCNTSTRLGQTRDICSDGAIGSEITAACEANAGFNTAAAAHSDTSDQVFRRHMISHSGASDHPEMTPSGAVW